MESTVDWHFYSSSLLPNLFRCFCHVLLYCKTPKQVFFNPINIYLTSFTTLCSTLLSILLFFVERQHLYFTGEGKSNTKLTVEHLKLSSSSKIPSHTTRFMYAASIVALERGKYVLFSSILSLLTIVSFFNFLNFLNFFNFWK